MRVMEIDSLSLPELEPYLTMRRPNEHREKGIFVAEGDKVVQRLVQSQLKVVSFLMTREWFDDCSDMLEQREIEVGVFIARKELLEEIVGYGLHQGIMAIGRVPVSVDVYEFADKIQKPRLLVAVDGIANSENMGVIVRNCAAFGVEMLIVGETSCDPFLRRAVRNSMGTIFDLKVARVATLAETLKVLREQKSMKIIAADPKDESISVIEVDLDDDVCLVFGSEGEGISDKVVQECNIRTKIPMKNEVDSINVASSVGVMLYECWRQVHKS